MLIIPSGYPRNPINADEDPIPSDCLHGHPPNQTVWVHMDCWQMFPPSYQAKSVLTMGGPFMKMNCYICGEPGPEHDELVEKGRKMWAVWTSSIDRLQIYLATERVRESMRELNKVWEKENEADRDMAPWRKKEPGISKLLLLYRWGGLDLALGKPSKPLCGHCDGSGFADIPKAEFMDMKSEDVSVTMYNKAVHGADPSMKLVHNPTGCSVQGKGKSRAELRAVLWQELEAKVVRTSMEPLRLKGCRPVCPFCDGKADKSCAHCHGSGFANIPGTKSEEC